MPRDRPRVPRDVIFFDFLLFLGGPGPSFWNIFCRFQCVVRCPSAMPSAVAVLALAHWDNKSVEMFNKLVKMFKKHVKMSKQSV